MKTLRKSQQGLIIPLALVMLSVGAMVTVPFLHHVQTGIDALSSEHDERYASDAGVEDAIWRLHTNYNGFADFTPENPSASYPIVVNGIDVYVTVELPNFPEGGPGGGGDGALRIKKVPDQPWIPAWQMNIVAFTIELKNHGQNSMSIDEIKDLLPMPFHYVQHSTSGVTTSNPTITWSAKNPVLTWDLSAAPVVIPPGEARYLNFRAMVIPPPGLLYSSVFARYQGTGETVDSGPTGAVAVAVYQITSTAGSITVEACVAADVKDVSIIAWQHS